jgi:hypothetical protein
LAKISCSDCQNESSECEVLLKDEANVYEFQDDAGQIWRKIYFGSGTDLQNWIDQSVEIFGIENTLVEEIDCGNLPCLAANERAFRIWAKKLE